mmetsp:Transcript_2580/g.4312  ORF Transcript_2580/g.4312 Transcript_2580/m.4312 type:complete len:464 (+) Transcript_2580:1224-2615(+)
MHVAADGALRGGEVSCHELQQGGLAGAVGPHKRNARVAVHTKVKVLVEIVLLLSAVRKADVNEGQHGWGQLVAVGEGELERPLHVDGRGEASGVHLIQDLLLGFSLLDQVGVGPAAGDELLDVLDVVLLLLVLLLLNDLLLRHRLQEGVVVTGVVRQSLVSQPDDVRAHAIQKVLRVRDEDEAAVVVAQVLLQPHARLQVEMVGGLIEQQERGPHEQCAREGDAHAPPTGHVLCALRHHLAGETQPVQELCGTALECVGVDFLQAGVDGLEALVFGAELGHDVLLQRLELLQLLPDVVDHTVQRRLGAGLGLRVQMVQIHVVGDGHLLLCQRAQEVGLPATVLADETVPAPDRELDRAVLDQLHAVEAQREPIDLDIARGEARRQHARYAARHALCRGHAHCGSSELCEIAGAPEGELCQVQSASASACYVAGRIIFPPPVGNLLCYFLGKARRCLLCFLRCL